jgi:hypothetical protein
VRVKKMKVIWTAHAQERQKEWEKKLGITKEEIVNLLDKPEQIVPGDMDVFVAQSRTRNGLLRVLFVEREEERKIVTVYWTSKIERYWKEKK